MVARVKWRSVPTVLATVAVGCLGLTSALLAPPTFAAGPEEVEDDRLAVTEELPFTEPEELTSSDDGVLRVTLTAAEAEVDISGTTVRALTYNGAFPWPTLRVAPGDRIELELVNDLDEPTNLYFHGLQVPSDESAGEAFVTVQPGQPFQYAVDLPDDHPSGTYWYHAYIHSAAPGGASHQVLAGLAGAIVVEGLTDSLPPELAELEERTLVLQDLYVQDGVVSGEGAERGRASARTVNGQANPRLDIVPGERQLWRLLNASANDFFHLSLDGHDFQVLAEDGNPVSQIVAADSLVMPPGKRYDVLIQGAAPRDYALRTVAYDQGAVSYAERVLATLGSAGELQVQEDLPDDFAGSQDLSASPLMERREITFTGDETEGYSIDGRPYDPQRVDHEIVVGTIEEWTVRNDTAEAHVFHLRTSDFQVMTVNGEPYEARGLQDTVIVPVGGEVVARIPFEDFTGRSVFHCHILAHQAAGMMSAIEVVSDPSQVGQAEGAEAAEDDNGAIGALVTLLLLFGAVGLVVYLVDRRRTMVR
jgi:suppressor of ftsI